MIQASNFSGNTKLTSRLRGHSQCLAVLLAGLVCFGSIGCCGPMGCGPGCVEHCYDCDGTNGRPIPMGPLQGLRNFKQQLTCGGGGCGEVYVGEWISTPPDCNDPCCGTQFVGGAVPSRPFCWAPGSLIQSLRISGRFDQGCADCGCDSGGCGGCDSCGGESFIDEGVSPVYESPVQNVAPSGCSTCSQGRASSSNLARTGRVQGRPANSRSMPNVQNQMARSSPTVRQSAPSNQSQGNQRMASTVPTSQRIAQTNVRSGNSRNRVANDPQVDRIRR